jgi:hypothetical protein
MMFQLVRYTIAQFDLLKAFHIDSKDLNSPPSDVQGGYVFHGKTIACAEQ